MFSILISGQFLPNLGWYFAERGLNATSNPCNVYFVHLVTLFGVLVTLFSVFSYLSI